MERPPAPLASRAVILLQGGLYGEHDAYFMKEVWYQYLNERLLGLFRRVVLAAPVLRGGVERYQVARVDDLGVGVLELQRRVRGAVGLVRTLRGADFAWIFLPTVRGLLGALVCRLSHVPYVAYLGSEVSLAGAGLPSWLRECLYRSVLRHAGAVIAAGGELEQQAKEFNRCVEAAIPAVRIDERQVEETVTLGPRPVGSVVRWLSVGTLHHRKRPDVILRAFALWQEVSGATGELHLVGSGPDADLRRLAADLGIAECVCWHGYVANGEELFAFYREADIYVLASEAEGFPRVLYEAMAFGVPIVTTPVSGIPYLLHDGVDCLMTPVGDPSRLADAVERLIRDDALREGLVLNALGVVRPVLRADGAAQVRRLVLQALEGARR